MHKAIPYFGLLDRQIEPHWIALVVGEDFDAQAIGRARQQMQGHLRLFVVRQRSRRSSACHPSDATPPVTPVGDCGVDIQNIHRAVHHQVAAAVARNFALPGIQPAS